MTELDATANGGPTPPVKSTNADCAPALNAVAGSCATNAPAPATLRDGAAGNLLTALVGPASPEIVAAVLAVKAEAAADNAAAQDEPVTPGALEVKRLPDPSLWGRAGSGGALDGKVMPDGPAEPDEIVVLDGTKAPDRAEDPDGTEAPEGIKQDAGIAVGGIDLPDGVLNGSGALSE